jgi:hypothetical protein
MLFYQNQLLVDAWPGRPGGKEFQVFHQLGGMQDQPAAASVDIQTVDTHKGQHTVRKRLSILEF